MQPSTADLLRAAEKDKEKEQKQQPVFSNNSWNTVMPTVQSTKVPAVEKPWL